MKKFFCCVLVALMAVVLVTACGSQGDEASHQPAALNATSLNVKLGESASLTVMNYVGEVKWSTSDKTIATVSESGVVTGVSIGSAAITAQLENDESKTCVVDVQPGESLIEKIVVTSLFSDASDITVNYESGNTVSLKATCTPSVTEKLTWSSSDELLAQVDSNGNVTVYGNGIVEIKAMALNGVEGKCTVRIKNVPAGVKPVVNNTTDDEEIPVIKDEEDDSTSDRFKSPVPVTSPSAKSSVIVSDKNVYLNVGENFTLTYAVSNTDPETIEWVSSDKAVAIVKNGRIVAIGEGRAVISAVTSDGAVANCSVAVGEKEIKAMKKEVSDSKR